MDDLNKIMYAVGPRRKVFWVNVHVRPVIGKIR